MLYAGAMTSPEKPKARWGDLIALGVGTGVIAYFTQAKDKYGGFRPTDDWWLDVLVVVGCLAGLAAITYLIIRAWDALTARIRRR